MGTSLDSLSFTNSKLSDWMKLVPTKVDPADATQKKVLKTLMNNLSGTNSLSYS